MTNLSQEASTRQRILNATAAVLSRNGYAGTRLSDIAEEAGVQGPGIYYYFASRDELIEAVVRLGHEIAQSRVDEALAALPADSSPLDKIVAAVEGHLRAVLDSSEYTTAAIRNTGQLPSHIRDTIVREQAVYGKKWLRLFSDAASVGVIRPSMDPQLASLLVLGALNWVPEWWRPHRASVEETVETATSLVIRGLAVTTDPQGH